MEVEARVSVQAMRGRFEQLQDDGPPANCTPKTNTSPGRTRSSSVIISKETPRSEEYRTLQGNLGTPTAANETDKKLSGVKCLPGKESKKSGSYLFGVVSSTSSSSKCNTTDSTPRKYSVDRTREHTEHKPGLPYNSKGEKADICNSDPKPSVVKRIPVFNKSSDGGLNSEGKKFGRDGEHEEAAEDSHVKRGRLFGHIRSRSHGNFIIKRDPSAEKYGHTAEKNDSFAKQRDNVINKDWLSQRRKQRSSDNLLGNQDSKSSSSFEGKQKIVANVVKNMKNKEKPKVLRKLSFSSKIEKELKNMKEKAISPSSKDKQAGSPLSSPEKVNKVNKMQLKQLELCKGTVTDSTNRSTMNGEEKPPYLRKNSPVSGAAIATIAIAKAVADVALKKSGAISPDTSDSLSSPSSDDTSPPSRPPRRRATNYGLLPHKKGKAPSPPSQSTPSPGCNAIPPENTVSNESSFSMNMSGNDAYTENRLSPDDITSRHSESPDHYQSSESLQVSFQSQVKSRETSPLTVTQNVVPTPSKRTIIGSTPVYRHTSESNNTDHVEKEIQVYKSELHSVNLGTDETSVLHEPESDRNYRILSKSLGCIDDCKNASVSEATKLTEEECLPSGPPPRKPPRTFAYDIYKNVKVSEKEDNQEQNDADETRESPRPDTNHPIPIYAVPVKKKKNGNKFIPKPPVRSKSDLTKNDISKPTVAPKPAHILTKAKRASVVDPLSCVEKDEEAAITSEFQRQAHIRYSLRKPKKPPPTPPPYLEVKGSHNSLSSPDSDVRNNNSTNQKNKEENGLVTPKTTLLHNCPYESNHNEYDSLNSLDSRRRSYSTSIPRAQNSHKNDCEDVTSPVPTVRVTSRSAYNLQTSPPSLEDDQPLSLGYCSVGSSSIETALHTKRSMSDETLYKGSRYGDEPVYATPILSNRKGSSDHNCERELHYMCSVLFTDEEEADAGRDGTECGRRNRRNSTQSKDRMNGLENSDGNKGRSSLISAWKREFRQSCRQVQNKIKKTVVR